MRPYIIGAGGDIAIDPVTLSNPLAMQVSRLMSAVLAGQQGGNVWVAEAGNSAKGGYPDFQRGAKFLEPPSWIGTPFNNKTYNLARAIHFTLDGWRAQIDNVTFSHYAGAAAAPFYVQAEQLLAQAVWDAFGTIPLAGVGDQTARLVDNIRQAAILLTQAGRQAMDHGGSAPQPFLDQIPATLVSGLLMPDGTPVEPPHVVHLGGGLGSVSTPAKVAVGAAAVVGTGLAAGILYSFATGKALDAVFSGAWRGVKRLFK